MLKGCNLLNLSLSYSGLWKAWKKRTRRKIDDREDKNCCSKWDKHLSLLKWDWRAKNDIVRYRAGNSVLKIRERNFNVKN